jgi:hypothetical protein
MRRTIAAYERYQVFLNYPFDERFYNLAEALHFAVVAAGLLPLCAKDISVPDRPRLQTLVEAIGQCRFSAHDLSRSTGEGNNNLTRMNMPIEMGMALFHALQTQRSEHRCVFFVPTDDEYRRFASDLAGLDPKYHENDEVVILKEAYEWLRYVVPSLVFNSQATPAIVTKFNEYRETVARVNGSAENGYPSHDESCEVMYQICSEAGWWDWRQTRAGQEEFPVTPIAWKP